jgi:protein phosphatase-4 regulatory subunit 3
VRTFLLEQKPEYGMFNELLNRVIQDPDHGIKGNSFEILRHLLDPESMTTDQSQERNQFMNLFYEKFVNRLALVFDAPAENVDPELNITRSLVCELLTYFVLTHGYRIKYYLLRSNLIVKICDLLKENEKYVSLCEFRST